MKEITIYSDGGSRNNPGEAAIGYVLYDEAGNILEKCGKRIGIRTNNEAEYEAIIAALITAKNKYNVNSARCFIDSQLVVNQAIGKFKVKDPKIKTLFLKLKNLESSFTQVSYTHILREKNKEADEMVNKALDNAIFM